MAEILDLYIQNNFGLMDASNQSRNTIIDTEGALVTLFMEEWGDTLSKRVIVGSNSINYYQDTMSLGINRDFNLGGAEEGPMMHLFNRPKGTTAAKQYVAAISDSSNVVSNVLIAYGINDESEFITWGDTESLFSSDVVLYQAFSACCCNGALFAYACHNTNDDLLVSVYDFVNSNPWTMVSEDTYSWYSISSCFTDFDGEGGAVAATGNPVPVDAAYVPFSWEDGAYGTPVPLGLATGVVAGGVMETEIAYDKINGNIIILTTFLDIDNAPVYDVVWELWISSDGGSNFTKLNLDTSGHLGGAGNFLDVVSYYRGTPKLLVGAEGGFLMGYTRLNSAGYARPYVHQCAYNSGGDIEGYTIGVAKECGTAIGPWTATEHMIGPLFFQPPADMLANIEPVQNIYIGYQIGEGTHMYASYGQPSTKSSGYILEKLDEKAFPITDSFTYGAETAGAGEITASIEILQTPTGHKDFYTEGYIGDYTDLTIDAFEKYGSVVTIEEYAPKDDVYIGGRTAYNNPITHLISCFLDASSWDNPSQALNKSDYDEFIDRDLRKIYLPPTFFMEYVTNSTMSETQQQSIYVAKFDSFTYEIRQVVPKFVNNQIVYWEANCYNVGNFDVWSRGGGAT